MAQFRVVNLQILDAQSTVNAVGSVPMADLGHVRELGCYICFRPGTTAGVVLVETAPVDAFDGQWALLSRIPWEQAKRAHYVAVTGALLALRVRIASAIKGGGVDAWIVGN